MDWSPIAKKIPAWLIVLILLIGTGVVVERIYWSKKPIILFGAYFGPPPLDEHGNDISVLIKKLEAENTRLKSRLEREEGNPRPGIRKNIFTTGSKTPDSTIQEYKDFQIELKECKRTGETVQCGFKVTNKGPSARFYISGAANTRLISQDGVEYKTIRQKIGSNDNPYDWGGALNQLSRDIPIEAAVWFGEVRPDVTHASLVDLSVGDFAHVEFRNVPIQR